MRQSLTWLIENGCELQKPDPRMLVLVYSASSGDPCRECNCKDTCPAWPKIGVKGRSTLPKSSSDQPTCPNCRSPLNAMKVLRRGGKCACGHKIEVV